MKIRIKNHVPIYLVIVTTAAIIGAYYALWKSDRSEASDIVVTVLTIVAGVTFWLEYHHNSKVNEAQFIMELNNQFISNKHMITIEHKLEQFYALVKDDKKMDEKRRREVKAAEETLRTVFALESIDRQYLVNYLVHLEGIATLVQSGVIKLSTITDLMSYRYFIAVNNPVVQELEILPYRDFYQGIVTLYPLWKRKLKDKPPMWRYHKDWRTTGKKG